MHPRGRLWKKAVNISLCREVRLWVGGSGSPLGVRLTWGDALVGAGVFICPRHCLMYGYAVRGSPLCMLSPVDLRSWFDGFGFWDGESSSVAFTLVAPSADHGRVAESVCSALAVRDYVIDFCAVWSARVFVVESNAAGSAVRDVVVDGLLECLLAYAFPCCGAGA